MDEITVRLPARPRGVVVIPAGEPLARPAASSPAVPPAAPPSAELEQLRAERQRIEALAGRMAASFSEAGQRRAREVAEWQRSAVELALAISARLLRRELDAGTFPLETIVRELLGSFGDAPEPRVHLHPDDLRLIAGSFDGSTPKVRLAADPALGRGDCRVEDGSQVAVIQLADYLSRVREELMRGLSHDAA